MNSLNLKILFIIGIASSLNACVEVDKTLGLDFVPNNAMINVEQEVFDIPVYTAKLDSVPTSSTTVGAVGWLYQEPFGLFTAGSVFRMLPYSLGFDYGTGVSLDSAVLTIVVSGRTQLNTTGLSQPLSLYPLKHSLAYNTVYYNTSLNPDDYARPEKISEDYTYKGEDTIRIRLDSTFAKKIMFASEDIRASDSLFLQKFQGFYLQADTSGASPGKGQVSYFDLTATYITFTYHQAGNDTTKYFYYFVEQSTPNFNVYKHDSKSLSNYDNPLPEPADTVYLEGLAGVKPYINFEEVRKSIANRLQQKGKDISKLAINKAELVVPVDYTTPDPAALDLCPALLTLAYKESDSAVAFTILTDTYFDTFGGALNRSLQQYSFNLTYYVQGMFNSRQTLYHTSVRDMYLYPIYSTYDSYGTEYKLLESNHYTCGKIKGTPAVKLKLTYTMLK